MCKALVTRFMNEQSIEFHIAAVIGQVQRYMGYVKEELAEKNQSVRGIIIAFEDDVNIRRALSVAPKIDFYTYKIHFKLEKKAVRP